MKGAARVLVKVIALAVVSGLAFHYRDAIAGAAALVLRAGWILIPALGLFFLWNHLATLAWRDLTLAVSGGAAPTSIWRLALFRIEAQALNLVLPAAGEVARAARMPDRSSRLGVALDLIACTVAEAAFALTAVLLHPRFRPTHALGIGFLLAGCALVVAAWAWLPLLLGALATRFRLLAARRSELLPAFRRAVGWHLLECILGVGEIGLFAFALAIPLSFESMFFAAAALRAASTLGWFVPAQVGVADGSLVWALTALGQPASSGLALALARRARQVVVLLVGALILVAGGRRRLPLKGQLHAGPVHPAS